MDDGIGGIDPAIAVQLVFFAGAKGVEIGWRRDLQFRQWGPGLRGDNCLLRRMPTIAWRWFPIQLFEETAEQQVDDDACNREK